MQKPRKLSAEQTAELVETLRKRFEKNKARHPGVSWDKVQARLEAKSSKLPSLFAMEETGGEPDVVEYDERSGELVFFDCSPESPKGRRSVCYDQNALESRKTHKPDHSALGMAAEMGISVLNEEQYQRLQALGHFDTRTSSWLLTPNPVRAKGGAIFGDWRYGQVFIYHNGAESYYAARGFRGALRI